MDQNIHDVLDSSTVSFCLLTSRYLPPFLYNKNSVDLLPFSHCIPSYSYIPFADRVIMAAVRGISEVGGSQNSVEIDDLARFAVQDYNQKQVNYSPPPPYCKKGGVRSIWQSLLNLGKGRT